MSWNKMIIYCSSDDKISCDNESYVVNNGNDSRGIWVEWMIDF